MRSWIGDIVPLADVVIDGGAVQPVGAGTLRLVPPRRPQAGDRERLAVEPGDEHRLLRRLACLGQRAAGLACLPLVEAVHRDQAAGLLEHALVRRLGRQRLGAGVDHLRPDLAFLRPHRDQAPVEDLQPRRAVGAGDDGVDVVRRGDVVVLAQRLALERRAEVLGDALGRARRHEATAHPSGWGDLNSRPLVPQTSALTKLRYSPSLSSGRLSSRVRDEGLAVSTHSAGSTYSTARASGEEHLEEAPAEVDDEGDDEQLEVPRCLLLALGASVGAGASRSRRTSGTPPPASSPTAPSTSRSPHTRAWRHPVRRRTRSFSGVEPNPNASRIDRSR